VQLAANLDEARAGLARLFDGADENDLAAAGSSGALYPALLAGIAAQYLIDPGNAPTGRDLAEALSRLTDATR
jgi:hypothetical protein